MIDKIVIVACGKGTRLQPLTNHIPKILINIHNDNILCKIINYWNKYCKKFIILINKEYNSYINFYLKQYEEIEYEIRNVEILNNEENSYTIKKGLYNLNNLKILITWCDVFPNEDIEFDKIYENCIFTNSLQCYNSRYLAKNNKIEKMSDYSLGNVIGIFYFINFKQISNKNDTQDLCDCYLDNFDCFETYEIQKIIDIGDMEKLKILYTNNYFNTRFFNNIKKIDFETIVKEATCEYGIKIINDEINFYKYIENNNIVYPIEKIFNVTYKSFCMKFIEKNTLYDEIVKNQPNNNIYNVLRFLQNYYNTNIKSVSIEEAKQDIYLETIIKITDRNKKIEDILNEFSYIKYVNSVKIDTYENILKRIENIINNFLNNKTSINYNIIHGDLNLSNIFKINENDFLFIDPRGYYGNSKMFGLKYYEISKIYLSMFGFDSFNRENEYFFSINDNNINTNINMLCDIEIYYDLFSEDEYYFIICLAIAAWLGTPYYFKNNISKTVGSYFYALYIATLYLDKIEKCYYNKNIIVIKNSIINREIYYKLDIKKPNLKQEINSYKKIIINKPWGYEFICYESEKLSILVLHIKNGHSTSMHSHRNKDTPMLLLQGCLTINSLEKEYIINPNQIVFINKTIFHKLCSHSDDTILLEFEMINPNKNDLLRYTDEYNRKHLNYESGDNYYYLENLYDINKYNYFEYNINSENLIKKFKDVKLLFTCGKFENNKEIKDESIIIILSGKINIECIDFNECSMLFGKQILYKKIMYLTFECRYLLYNLNT